MAQWRLAEVFHAFVEHSPVEALRSLIDIVQFYVDERNPRSAQAVATFSFGESYATIVPDHSYIWDSGSTHDGEESIRMLNIFTEYLQNIVVDPGRFGLIEQIVSAIVKHNRAAVFWKKILVVAARNPSSLGILVRPLAWAKPVLVGHDTTTAAGAYIGAIYDYLEPSEKVQLEKCILSITDGIYESESLKYAQYKRNRLLGCIVEKSLILEETRQIVADLVQNDAVPSNDPLFSIESGWGEPYTDEDFLTEQGVSLETPENRQILQLQNLIKEFSTRYQNTVPSEAEAGNVITAILDLENILNLNSDKIEPVLRDFAWGYLAQG